MIAVKKRPPLVSCRKQPMVPVIATITGIHEETANTRTYSLEIDDAVARKLYHALPGQFNMLYVFGVGEAAISISSDAQRGEPLQHTVRHVGSVTFAIGEMKVGDKIGVRGPMGRPWPVEACKGKDIVLVAGGIGLAPIRSAIYHVLRNRGDYGRVVLAYGARSPGSLLYYPELKDWTDNTDIDILLIVDYPDEPWAGPVGKVTDLLRRVRVRSEQTAVFVCGPRIMNRFVVFNVRKLHVPDDQIFVSLERNMRCGIGQCGHCQYGSKFVCKDGPVFPYRDIEHFFGLKEV